jgi:glycosyltransferase involved in cell wall biosynthesis
MASNPPTRPTLSVVLPNYNHSQLVGRALTALLSQEHPADEILVVDDGSTDDSLHVIGEIATKAPTIRILTTPSNTGVAPTLQRGLESARGKYVYFAASDDWVLPGFFELAVRRLEANPDVGLFCGEAILIDGRKDQPYTVRPATRARTSAGVVDAKRTLKLLKTTDNWILTGSSVFRRDCVVSAGGLNPKLGSFADGYMARKVAIRFGFYFEPKFTAAWAVLPGSVSRKTASELQKAQYFLDIAPTAIAQDSAFPDWYADLFRDRWRFATCRLALEASPIDKDFVLAMGARSTTESAQLRQALSLPNPQLARAATLVLLWYRLRPTALTALLKTMLAMRWTRLFIGFRLRRISSITPSNVEAGKSLS